MPIDCEVHDEAVMEVSRLRKRIANLEEALCRIAYIHQELDVKGPYSRCARAQDIAAKAIEHIEADWAQEIAQREHAASLEAETQ